MRSRYRVSIENGIYFVTSTLVWWIPIFTSRTYFDILIEAFRFSQKEKGLQIYAFVILDNHLHAALSHPKLSQVLQSIKSYSAKIILNQLQKDDKRWAINIFAYQKKHHKTASTHQVWQEGFHPQLIKDEEMLIEKIDYIHYNPVKRGLVAKPEHWIYSSASHYAGKNCVLKIDELPI